MFSLGFWSCPFVLPCEDVLKGLVATVGVKLIEEGRVDDIGVIYEAEHRHSHFSEQRSRDVSTDVQQVLDADTHTVLA